MKYHGQDESGEGESMTGEGNGRSPTEASRGEEPRRPVGEAYSPGSTPSPGAAEAAVLANLVTQWVQKLAVRVPKEAAPASVAERLGEDPNPDGNEDTPSVQRSEALGRWLPYGRSDGLDLDAVLEHLRDIEEGAPVETQPASPRRAPSLPPPRHPPRRRSQPPPPLAAGPDAPAVDDLLRRTLDSYPPPASRSVDDSFTARSLYDDMRESMNESLAPVALPADLAEDDAPETEPDDALPGARDARTTAPPHRLVAIAAGLLACVALAAVCTVAMEEGISPARAGMATARAPAAWPEPLGATHGVPLASPTRAVQPTDAGAAPLAAEAVLPDPERDQDSPSARRSAPAEAKGPTVPPADAVREPTGDSEQDAGPAAPKPFDQGAAAAAVEAAAARATGCADGERKGRAQVHITFAPSGRATSAVLAGHSALAGTSVGSCVALAMRTALVPPFEGDLVTVSKTVHVP